MSRMPLLIVVILICGGCNTFGRLPEIPEYHPAHALAPEGLRVPSFDVLVIDPVTPPELPVPELDDHDQPSEEMDHNGHMQHEMEHGDNHHHNEHNNHGNEHQADMQVHERPLHGVVVRPGMKDGVARPRPFEHEAHHDHMQMDPIVIPSEQRGMRTDETLYREYRRPYSTSITQPRRSAQLRRVEGPQVWTCPRHPPVKVATPGGRCPRCETFLVPVMAGAHE